MTKHLTLAILVYLFSTTTLPAQFQVYGAIGELYNKLRAANPSLGKPIGKEEATGDGVGRFQKFSGYDIYWHPKTGAHFLSGAVKDRYYAAGGVATLGYPVTDVTNCGTAARKGLYVDFQRFKNPSIPEQASIYWSQKTGAFEIYGAICARYKALKGPKSCLGYPTSLEVQDGPGRMQKFENNSTVKWTRQAGAKESCVFFD